MRTVSLTVLVVLGAGILSHGEASTGECDSMRHTCDSNFALESDEMMLLQVSAHVTGSAKSQSASDLGNEEPTFSRTGPSPSPRPIHLAAYNQSHGSLLDVTQDINQKVFIDGQPVLGDSTGLGRLDTCTELAEHIVNNPMGPEVKVCGTGVRITVFLLGRCGEGSVNSANLAHTWEVGACDTGLPPDTCESMTPSQDKRMGVAQSYRITRC